MCHVGWCVGGLTADLQLQRLPVLADGVAGGAEVLAGVGELDIFQGEGGHPGVAANHNIPVEALQKRKEKGPGQFLTVSLAVIQEGDEAQPSPEEAGERRTMDVAQRNASGETAREAEEAERSGERERPRSHQNQSVGVSCCAG